MGGMVVSTFNKAPSRSVTPKSRPGRRDQGESMDQVPLDPETYLRVRDRMAHAVRLGLDEVEDLNRAGLLLTPAQDKLIRLQAMNYLVRQVQSWRPAEFLRRKFHAQHSASPSDMYSCILEFLEEHVEWWEREQ